MIKSVGFHHSQCAEFIRPLLNHRIAYMNTYNNKLHDLQKSCSLFHMKLFSTYLICLTMQCDSLVPATVLHKCFFVSFANAACSSLGWDAQLLLYILLLEM